MPIPVPNLDDLRFQHDLVDEARRRIIHYCPEWTEYNLSDPGITLIELFAWMTEVMVYRLNQVPEKNHIEFLNLLGMQPQPASSARADLTFWLSVSLPISAEDDMTVVIPDGTEVLAAAAGAGEPVTFTTDQKLVIVPPKLTQLRREDEFHKNYLPRLGIETFYAFSQTRPQVGDTFYLGFDERWDVGGHILELDFECERTQAVGVRREDPPWVWECSLGDGRWQEVAPSARVGEKDTTGGLNNPRGRLVLYLPMNMRPDQVHGRQALWIRCRIEQRRLEQGMYTESPRVISVTAHTLGATVPASHAVFVREELLGRSNGEPGQVFKLEHAPILELRADETVEVEEKREGEIVFVPWECAPDFSHSSRFDRHFTVDTAAGEIAFGPAIRQPDGTVRQYGRVPEAGRAIRFTRYRRGGGTQGNVPAETLQSMATSLAYVARVANLSRAAGGRDPETLEEVKARARRELRAQLRAVTAEDYELLAKGATRSVARAKCNTPRSGDSRLSPGTVEVLIVPAVVDALQNGDLTKLHVDEGLARVVAEHLDEHRLLTTVVRIGEPSYLGVKVRARIVASELSRPEAVQARVVDVLRSFLCPLSLASDPEQQQPMGDGWEGWPFGRNLYVAEIASMIQRVPGVKHVLDVELSTRPVVPSEERSLAEENSVPEEVLQPVEQKVVKIAPDTLLCSLQHEVVLVALDEDEGQDA